MKNKGIIGVAIVSALVLVAIFTLSEDETEPARVAADGAKNELAKSGVVDAAALADLSPGADKLSELEAQVASLKEQLASAQAKAAPAPAAAPIPAPASSDRVARLETQLRDARRARSDAQAEANTLRAAQREDRDALSHTRRQLAHAQRAASAEAHAAAARIAGLEGTLKIRSDRLAAAPAAAPAMRMAAMQALPRAAEAAPAAAPQAAPQAAPAAAPAGSFRRGGDGVSQRALAVQNDLRQDLRAAQRRAARVEGLERALSAARAETEAARQAAAARIAGLEGTLKIRSERAGAGRVAPTPVAFAAPAPRAASNSRLVAVQAAAAAASQRAMDLQATLRQRTSEARAQADRIDALERDLAQAQADVDAARQTANARIAGLEGTLKVRADRADAAQERASNASAQLAMTRSRLANAESRRGVDPRQLRQLQAELRRNTRDLADAEERAERLRGMLAQCRREASAGHDAASARIAGLEATLKIRQDRLAAMGSAGATPVAAQAMLKAADASQSSEMQNRAMLTVVSAQQRELAQMRGQIEAMRAQLSNIEQHMKLTD